MTRGKGKNPRAVNTKSSSVTEPRVQFDSNGTATKPLHATTQTASQKSSLVKATSIPAPSQKNLQWRTKRQANKAKEVLFFDNEIPSTSGTGKDSIEVTDVGNGKVGDGIPSTLPVHTTTVETAPKSVDATKTVDDQNAGHSHHNIIDSANTTLLLLVLQNLIQLVQIVHNMIFILMQFFQLLLVLLLQLKSALLLCQIL